MYIHAASSFFQLLGHSTQCSTMKKYSQSSLKTICCDCSMQLTVLNIKELRTNKTSRSIAFFDLISRCF